MHVTRTGTGPGQLYIYFICLRCRDDDCCWWWWCEAIDDDGISECVIERNAIIIVVIIIIIVIVFITVITMSNNREGACMTEYTVSRQIFVWGFYGPSQIDDGRGVHQSNICTTDFKLTFGSVSIFFLLSCRRSVVLVIAITISLSIGQLMVDNRRIL